MIGETVKLTKLFFSSHGLLSDIQTKNKSANCDEFSWLFSTFFFLFPSLSHGTTSQSTVQFAAIVYDLWVDFFLFNSVNFPSEKMNSH